MRFRVFVCSVLLFAISIIFFPACTKKAQAASLVIYCYDSFASEWGPGPAVIPGFEEKTGIKVELRAVGDAGQALARVILEKSSPAGDIIIGIDNNMLPQALAAKVLAPYMPSAASAIPVERVIDPSWHLTPFDYGNFAIIYDSDTLSDPPESLEELASLSEDKSIILMDPRTSSPGFGFLLWTIAAYPDSWQDYWRRLSPKILTITDGWDSGYGLFTSGEAPMVLSYTTSPAYHAEYENTDRYRAAIFSDGHYGQIEGAGIIKGGPNTAAAEKFIDYVLSADFQKEIPLTNWMYPVTDDIPLPSSFDMAPRPEKTLLLDPDLIAEKRAEWIKEWTMIMLE